MQLDMFAAKADRDAALEQVEHNGLPWMEYALAALRWLPAGMTGTAEDFRGALWDRGLESPHHHNAWGALIMNAVRRKLLVPTGEYRAMSGPGHYSLYIPTHGAPVGLDPAA